MTDTRKLVKRLRGMLLPDAFNGDALTEAADTIESLTARLAAAEKDAGRLKLYDELIYAVATKFPGESRHQTALRYIMQAESRNCGVASAARSKGEWQT